MLSTRRSIKDWDIEDRPREKMMAKGEASLSNAELLAILIGSGTPKKSAVELMKEVMDYCDGRIARLSQLSIDELTSFNGIGEAKAITIKAAAEIGRRRAQEKAADIQQVANAPDIYSLMHPLLQDLRHEELWLLLLNNNSRIIKRVRLSQGGITATLVDVRAVMREALLAEATNIVLCHNHPSGSVAPSREDIRITESVKNAAAVMDIRLVDHVIITDGNYYSFADNGKI